MRCAISRPLLRLSCLALLAGLSLLGARNAQAASICYGDFSDIPPGTVTFKEVQESSITDSVPLFGAPTVIADTLDFDPIGFGASSAGGVPDITDGQLNFGLWSDTGMTSISFSEAGDYTLAGAGTAATQVIAGLNVMVDILAVDGMVLDEAIQVGGNVTFMADLVNDAGIVVPWSLGLVIDLAGALLDEQMDFQLGVTHAEVVLDNQLLAFSELGSVAFIAKKDFTVTVPEPTSLLLGSLALLALLRPMRRA